MSLLLDDAALDARRAMAPVRCAPLADGLLAELAPLLDGRVEIPREKALLSRAGGRCPHDGTLLRFDPLDPRHICPRCGTKVAGELHDRFRPYWMQLWLAERVLHARRARRAARRRTVHRRGVARARRVRRALSRVSESRQRARARRGRSSARTSSPSGCSSSCSRSICSSRRRDRAATSARRSHPRSHRRAEHRAHRVVRRGTLQPTGLEQRGARRGGHAAVATTSWSTARSTGRRASRMHLADALLGDGSWYEGENYHLFAHRGLWYAMTIAERLGRAPDAVAAHALRRWLRRRPSARCCPISPIRRVATRSTR